MMPRKNTNKARTPRRPLFLREIRQLGDEVGLINATQQLLERDNVMVLAPEADAERLKAHQGGLLFVGDHRNQWEFAALMSVLSRIGRKDMLNVAKFYVQRQVQWALGERATSQIIPVYPRILARDREEVFNSETVNRFWFRRNLLTMADSEKVNTQTLQTASNRLAEGGVVNIFPCGSVVEAIDHPWRKGVGAILSDLDVTAQAETLVVPYRLQPMSKLRLIAAVALRGQGIAGRPQTLALEFGPMHTAAEIIDTLPIQDKANPEAITEQLRQQYLGHFAGAAERSNGTPKQK